MSSSGKLFLCLAVLVCAIQAISARPRLDANFIENVKFDLTRKCTSLNRDIEKDTLNVRHKVTKEALKLSKKAIKSGSLECVESAKVQTEEQLEEKAQEIRDCIQEVRDSVESAPEPEATLAEIMSFRNDAKNKLQICKKNGKADLKAIQTSFSAAGKACIV